MKVVVLGKNGMLGGALMEVMGNAPNVELIGIDRESFEVKPETLNELGAKLNEVIGKPDYVINCIGAIKPMFDGRDQVGPTYTNAIFPHYLADWGELTGVHIVHITTDCVYSGKDGQYDESSKHDPLDAYGKSKSLGEPVNAMVIRTSIIGPEFGGRKRSFLEWLKGEDGGKIKGFTNHYWNGLTTYELGFSLLDIIDYDIWTTGTYHLFGDDVTKFDMVTNIIGAYGLNIEVEPFETEAPVDRTLRSTKDLRDFIQPQPFDDMIAQMYAIEVSNK
jgi:dTDP-4-dehydrorhamnose reductase